MFVLILIIHVLVCFALMAVVLMQSGKGRGLAGAFGGGGGNQTLFGGRGAVDFLGKATWVLGAAFMLTSLTLALMSAGQGGGSRGSESLIKKAAGTAPMSMPSGVPAGGSEPGSVPADGSSPAGGSLPAPPSPTPAGASPGGK